MAHQILVVEDQDDIKEVVLTYLEREGYVCEALADGLLASARLAERSFDAVVLDWMLPGRDGLSLCREVKQRTPLVPVIILSAHGNDQQRVEGLQAGADDFLAKPFHPRELVARVRALLRRSRPILSSAPQTSFGELTVDAQGRRALYRDQLIPCSGTELSLLLALAARPEATVSRQQLLDLGWDNEFAGSERTVDSHIRRLRARLEEIAPGNRWIESVWGVGYRFNPAGHPLPSPSRGKPAGHPLPSPSRGKPTGAP